MTISDLLIIYLAFGAPLAVYKYLQSRGSDIRRRILVSGFTFFFWVPVAVEIGYLYVTNAYFGDQFVSRRSLDAQNRRLVEIRESITAELIRLTRGSNLHDLRETVERYAGLADAARNNPSQRSERHEFFEAAGREKYELGRLCLIRRNRTRLERHHIQARQDFLALFEQISGRFGVSDAIAKAVDLARQLDDDNTVKQLRTLQSKRGEVWNSEQQEQPQAVTPVSSIVMTASLNND